MSKRKLRDLFLFVRGVLALGFILFSAFVVGFGFSLGQDQAYRFFPGEEGELVIISPSSVQGGVNL